jgi:hypothetical protein
MKKIICLFFVLAAISAPLMADKLFFTEFGLNYSTVISPGELENNTTGVYDTAVWDAKVGVNAYDWVNVYGGAAFYLFVNRDDPQMHYTFFPLYLGVRVNVMPDMMVYPDLSVEYGSAIANQRTKQMVAAGGTSYEVNPDNPWYSTYYNFGIGANWRINDIAILRFDIERPTVLDRNNKEIHFFKSGLAWKIFY